MAGISRHELTPFSYIAFIGYKSAHVVSKLLLLLLIPRFPYSLFLFPPLPSPVFSNTFVSLHRSPPPPPCTTTISPLPSKTSQGSRHNDLDINHSAALRPPATMTTRFPPRTVSGLKTSVRLSPLLLFSVWLFILFSISLFLFSFSF